MRAKVPTDQLGRMGEVIERLNEESEGEREGGKGSADVGSTASEYKIGSVGKNLCNTN